MTTMFQVKTRILALGLLALLAVGARLEGADPTPDVAEIMQRARLLQRSQHRVFEGKLRNAGEEVPFRLVLEGSLVRYEFKDGRPPLVLKLGKRGTTLEIAGDEVKGTRLEDPIAGTDITYEDLSLKFLFWDLAKLEGEKVIVMGQTSWQVSLLAPRNGRSQYGSVRVWIDKKSGALTRAECFDRKGRKRKEFKVISLQKLDDGTWALKKMRIQAMDGERPVDSTPTYLELRD
jgi:hypothetical protein